MSAGLENQTSPEVLYPETLSQRRLPLNLKRENLPLFDNELQRVIPQTTLLEFCDVRVSPEGILFKGGKMLPQSFAFQANFKRWKLRSRMKFFVNNYLLNKTRAVERDVLWVTDDWSVGYFHWLTDVLSRLYVVRNRLDELMLLLPQMYESIEFVHSSLSCFGVKSVKFIGPNEVLRCRRIVMPSHTAPSGHYNEEIIRGVRKVLLNKYGDSLGTKGDRIYISRGRALKRRIANEEAVEKMLSDHGFQTIYGEDLSFQEQVKICSRAKYLVSNHGAGLTNMLFVTEGANVLELRHQTDRINNCYFTLSSALNLNYFYQTCEAAQGDEDAHSADLIVDQNTFKQNLQLLLKST